MIGIIPAAGHAVRLQPLAASKEVLEVGGRPVMDYLVERMRHAGCERIRVVTREDKDDVVRRAGDLGAEVLPGSPPSLAASVLLGLAGLPDGQLVLLGFPDSVWEPIDGFVPLRTLVEGGHPIALGLFTAAEPGRSDVVQVRDDPVAGPILGGIASKPGRSVGSWIWGCLAARTELLRELSPAEELADLFRRVAGRQPVPVVRLGRLLDIGTPDALRHAEADPVVRATRRPPPGP
jgi:hypothetical protein